MEYVEQLLKRRKEAARLELDYCEEKNEHFDSARNKLRDEISQIDESLLILSNVSGCIHPYEFVERDIITEITHCTKCDQDII